MGGENAARLLEIHISKYCAASEQSQFMDTVHAAAFVNEQEEPTNDQWLK